MMNHRPSAAWFAAAAGAVLRVGEGVSKDGGKRREPAAVHPETPSWWTRRIHSFGWWRGDSEAAKHC